METTSLETRYDKHSFDSWAQYNFQQLLPRRFNGAVFTSINDITSTLASDVEAYGLQVSNAITELMKVVGIEDPVAIQGLNFNVFILYF